MKENSRISQRDIGLGIEQFDLVNGMHVILHRDTRFPVAAVNLWYHVGSANEHEGESGFAHLFEHMMFQGSEHVPVNMHFQHVQSAGGNLNASTSFDRTNYYETLPSHQLETGLWLEADRMKSLAVTAQTLENQRSVVMEERRSRYDNQPYGTMLMELFDRAYRTQAYRRPTIGSMADIEAATLEQVRSFHDMYYQPANASLCIAGDFETEATVELVERYFGELENRDGTIYRPTEFEAPQTAQRRDTVYDGIPLPGLVIGMHIPDLNSPQFLALDLLSSILTSGRSARLYRSMTYESRIAQSVISHAFELEHPGLFIVRAIAQPGHSPEELEVMIWDELERIRREGVTEAELTKAKNRMESGFVASISSLQSRADLLNSFHVLSGDAGLINSQLELINAVTAEQVLLAARDWLHENNSTVLNFLPHPRGDSEA